MSDRDRRDKVMPGDLTAYERWELPALEEQGGQTRFSGRSRVKPMTADEVEAVRQEAWEDGRREGYEAGYASGRDEGYRAGHQLGEQEGRAAGEQAGRQEAEARTRESVEQALGRLETLMGQLADPLASQEDDLETALLNLTLALVRAVIHRELQIDSRQIRAVLQEALEQLPNDPGMISIRVNPADEPWVKEVADRLEASPRIEVDERIMAGGCQVENRSTLVDSTVEKRFQKAIQQMLDRQMGQLDGAEQTERGALMGEMTDLHREVLDSDAPADEPGGSPPEPEEGDHDPG